MQTAILIDADNTQLSKLDAIIRHLTESGHVLSIRRAYGNWSKPALAAWQKKLNHHGIKAEQQFDYAIDKNATDMALTIDAMDILHNSSCETFVIVSSDCDFTPLAIRLREAGRRVVGYGRKQTPEAFRNSCAEFIFLERLEPNDEGSAEAPAQEPAAAPPPPAEPAKPVLELDEDLVHKAIQQCAAQSEATDRFVNLTNAGQYLSSTYPNHKLRFAGHAKLLAFLEAHPEHYELKREGALNRQTVKFRCMADGAPLPSISLARIHVWLRRAAELSNRKDHYATVSHAGTHLHRLAREEGKVFNVKQYGYPKLVTLIRAFPKLYTVKENVQNGVTVCEYTCKSIQAPQP